MSCLAKVSKKVSLIGLITILTCAIVSTSYAQDILKTGYPERYTVTEGDTLWGISGKFLNEPWRWPELWKGNLDIENPDLIYPGDVLVLTFVDGKPVLRALKRETVNLSPTVRVEDISKAIPPISPGAIKPFLSAPLITTEEEIAAAPYIVDGFDGHLIGGRNEQMYARGLEETEKSSYQIFRAGRTFVHPVSGEVLGLEAIDLGDADLAKAGDPARILITSSNKEIDVLDRLRKVDQKETIPFFFPRANPYHSIRGYVLPDINKAPELGPLDKVIAISIGERESVKPGHVFRIQSQPIEKVDPLKAQEKKSFYDSIMKKKETFTIPREDIGLAMVFRVFDKVSYAIITNAERPISPGDRLVHPNSIY